MIYDRPSFRYREEESRPHFQKYRHKIGYSSFVIPDSIPSSWSRPLNTNERSATAPGPRVRLTPVVRIFLLIGLSALLGTVLGALTGEKTTFLYKEELHLSASGLATLGILLNIPSYLQPFMGAWADLKPLLGYHRRSYYVIGTFIGSMGYLGLACMHSYHLWSVVCLILIAGFFAVFSGVIVNAVMVAVGNSTATFGRMQTLSVFIPYVLSLAYTSHLSGYVAQHWSYGRAYGMAAFLSLLFLPMACLIEDQRVTHGREALESEEAHIARMAERHARNARNRAQLKQSMRSPGLWALVGFIFYLIITPGPNSTYYFTDGLHLSKQFIGDTGRWTSVGALLGMGLFAFGNKRLPVIALVLGAWLMDCAGYPAALLMRDATSVHWMSLISAAIGIIYGLCLNTLAARACPPGLEGTIYGLVMAAIALAGSLCGAFGNWIYDYFGPAHHHSVTYGWNASLGFGLAFTLVAGLLIPFMPAWTRSRRPLSAALPMDVNRSSVDRTA